MITNLSVVDIDLTPCLSDSQDRAVEHALENSVEKAGAVVLPIDSLMFE